MNLSSTEDVLQSIQEITIGMTQNDGCSIDLEREAKIFGKYLINRQMNPHAISLYKRAHRTSDFTVNADDARILRLIYKYPFLLGPIDAGLVFQKKDSVLRKKIFYMLAILETTPEYSEHFLSTNSSFRDVLEFFYSGIRGVFRMVVGYFLVKML